MMEKHGAIKPQGKKRTVSGTNLNDQNSFAVLSNDKITSLACDMGVDTSSMSFDTVDLMKDMEIASHALVKSKEIPILDPNSCVLVEELSPKVDVPLLEWLEKDLEVEHFTLV
jgi:hypothetical protein